MRERHETLASLQKGTKVKALIQFSIENSSRIFGDMGGGPAPPSPAVIDAASVYSPYGDNRLYVAACSYTMDVTATVRNATSVRVQVEGTMTGPDMERSGSTYRYTLRSGMFAASDVGVRRVLIVATGGGTTVTTSAGRVDIRLNCPKD